MGRQPGTARPGLSRGPLDTAPNPRLLQQEQIKAPRGVGRRGQTPTATDQSPRWPFVPGEEAIPAPVSGVATSSEAPPSSLHPSSPVAPERGPRQSHQPALGEGAISHSGSNPVFVSPSHPFLFPRAVTAVVGHRGGGAGEGTHGAVSPPRRSSAGTPEHPNDHSGGAADGHHHGKATAPAPSAGRESQTSQGKFLPGAWPKALFHQGAI